MKTPLTIRVRTVALAAFLLAGRVSAPDPGSGDDKIDWPAFLRRHDMTFDRLLGAWSEAPHFGNAMVGSMLYRADDTIRLQVFRADVHDHRDEAWGWAATNPPRPSPSTSPIGF